MKILQTSLLKILVSLALFFFITVVHGQPPKIRAADSLFRSKQYTQSMALYQQMIKGKEYSPSMLLKMAFIQEGLGKIGPTLYYLKLYYLASDDEQALQKMEELASKFKLNGYSPTDADRLKLWVSKNLFLIQFILASLLFFASILVFLQRKKNKVSWSGVFFLFTTMALLSYLNNFYSIPSVIVSQDHTYLMDAPSAGARVVGIIGEGNQLEPLGQTDVWLRVRWQNKAAYLKANSVLHVTL